MIVEAVGGVLTDSLALVADAGHMLTHIGALALALVAMWLAERPPSPRRTFGFARVEVLSALLNIIVLWLFVAYVIWEAVNRFGETPEVQGALTMGVGAGGLAVNALVAVILHRSAEHSLNIRGAMLHVIGDMLGSLAVVVSGAFVLGFGWNIADPIVSLLISVSILALSWRAMMQVLQVLVEGAPQRLNLYQLCADIEELDGVTLIHDVHAWTITSGYDAISAHILIDPESSVHQAILEQATAITRDRYQLRHITFQIETSAAGCLEDHHLDHLHAFGTES